MKITLWALILGCHGFEWLDKFISFIIHGLSRVIDIYIYIWCVIPKQYTGTLISLNCWGKKNKKLGLKEHLLSHKKDSVWWTFLTDMSSLLKRILQNVGCLYFSFNLSFIECTWSRISMVYLFWCQFSIHN